ncbi:hypothetical protein GOP47_0008910 [Adiantum capillus-veneris]|uniref:Kin17 KOW domain-containing protein n=1 Tax=Adiantum capillus-veneris TaxID=13818 RepID=A0A9D4UZ78_ADICA|nr:hypothetical protein GOP47_0008910 [Adiantum capillus-veneris]
MPPNGPRICKVEISPKGCFITYKGHRADEALLDNLQKKRHRAAIAYEDRQERDLLHQIDRAAHNRPLTSFPPPSPPPAPNPASQKVRFSLHPAPKGLQAPLLSKPFLFQLDSASDHSSPSHDIWISPGLVVKVTALNPHCKKKGVVRKVLHDSQIAVVERLDTSTSATFHVHQNDLQTVIPELGTLLRIVRGIHRSSTAQLLSIDTARFAAAVRLDAGPVLPSINYEDIFQRKAKGKPVLFPEFVLIGIKGK